MVVYSILFRKKAILSGSMINDLAYLTIDFKADFSSLFDWNTKQLFIYIFAEYATANNVCDTSCLKKMLTFTSAVYHCSQSTR